MVRAQEENLELALARECEGFHHRTEAFVPGAAGWTGVDPGTLDRRCVEYSVGPIPFLGTEGESARSRGRNPLWSRSSDGSEI